MKGSDSVREGASKGRSSDHSRTSLESDAVWDCVRDLLQTPDAESVQPVLGLPTARALRSLVVIKDRRAAARLVMRQFGPGGVGRGLRAGALALSIVTGIAGKIPALDGAAGASALSIGYRDWLRQAMPLGAEVGAILLGPPRANRKPVVLLVDGRGQLLAVAKVGVNEVTNPLVRREVVALKQIGEALGGTVHVPRLLSSGSVGKSEVLLMAPLPAVAGGRRPTRRALIEVVRKVGHIDRRPGPDLRQFASHPRLAPLRSVADEVARSTNGVEVGSFHGDLHPGNLAMARDGHVMLWDWERWGHGAPLGFDLLHHDLHTWISRHGMAPREAAAALIAQSPYILAPLGVRSSVAPMVGRDYLIRLGARYTADQQDLAGSGLGAVEEWLFPAVLE